MRSRLALFGTSAAALGLLAVAAAVVVPRLMPQDVFYGMFTNRNMVIQKVVSFPGGFKDYESISDLIPIAEGTEQIISRWEDSEGSVWYKTRVVREGAKYLVLHRISRSGTVMEFAANEVPDLMSMDFPVSLDQAGTAYRIYYRAGR